MNDAESANHNIHQSNKTLGSMMGEIVWLMTQSPTYKLLNISDLEWLLMPPILLNQYKLFYNNGTPAGAALWGYLSLEGEERLKNDGRINPEDWGNNILLNTANGIKPRPGGTLWLIELIAPFATAENQQRDQMLQDLVTTTLKDTPFKLMHINPVTSLREVITLGE